MIHLILAVVLAQPCMAPVTHHSHANKHHVIVPVQSCVVPPVPMCYRTPEQPEPDEIVLPPLPYYPALTDTAVSIPETPIAWDTVPLLFGGSVVNVPPTMPAPPTSHCCYVPPVHQTPEISVDGSVSAVMLLLGSITIIRSKRI